MRTEQPLANLHRRLSGRAEPITAPGVPNDPNDPDDPDDPDGEDDGGPVAPGADQVEGNDDVGLRMAL